MFGIERLQLIRKIVIKEKSVEVTSLSKELSVSEVTIRRDLDKLEKEGLVVKTYGGAILVEDIVTKEANVQQDIAMPIEEDDSLKSIAKMCSKIIEDYTTIFIDGGLIGLSLVHEIKHHEGLIVVTNNLDVAFYLHKETDHKVVIIGGEVNQETGDVEEYEQLMDLLLSKAFISVDGIEIEVGYTADDKSKMRLFKVLKSVSREVVIATKSDVFYKRGLVRVAPLEDIKTIITDSKIPDEFKSFYYENNIKVHASSTMKL